MDEKKLEIYYDHYKDTFENQKNYLQKRNNYFLIGLVLLVTLSFQISNPEQSIQISNTLIKDKIGEITIDFAFINSILLFAFLWIVIMYFQINLLIERNYRYIKNIEETLSKNLSPYEISREGKTYIKQLPWFSSVVHRIYSIFFPIILVLVICLKWFAERNNYNGDFWNGNFWFNTIIVFVLFILTILYLIGVHFNDFKKTN
jgi:hypothetical protein